jgi:Protein of unknown function (DUF2721)
MKIASIQELIPVLQTAIGPFILISGVGLLLLSMTNRLGRAIDRARLLGHKVPPVGDPAREGIMAQLAILWRRARLLRLAIILAAASALSAALLIILLFVTALLHLESSLWIIALFSTGMCCLLGSLIVFIHDLNQGLAALRLELNSHQIITD